MKKRKTNILYNLTCQNENEFSWKELNCIQRPLAYAIRFWGEQYYYTYLLFMSFITSYSMFDKIEIYKTFIEEITKIKLVKVYFTNKLDMINKIKKSIDLSKTVVMPCDMIKLFYFTEYERQHHDKNFIIKGYDLERKLFYILDNVHIDFGTSTLLSDFVCSFNDMYIMNQEFISFYEKEDKQYFYCFEKELFDVLSYEEILYFFYKIIKKINKKEFVVNMREMLLINSSPVELSINLGKINFKKVYQKVLIKLLKINKCSQDSIDLIENQFNESEKIWNSLKLQIIHKIAKGETISVEIKNKLAYFQEIELKTFKIIEDEIEKLKLNINKKNSKKSDDFIIHNYGNACIQVENKMVKISIDDKKTYEMWNFSEEAPHCLFYCEKNNFKFQTDIRFSGEIGEGYHLGIILKGENGEKYLFGNIEGNRIVVFNPDEYRNYELFNYVISDYFDVLTLCCTVIDHKINFTYKIDNIECKKKFERKLDFNIIQVGVFLRSFKRTSVKAIFDNINLQIMNN